MAAGAFSEYVEAHDGKVTVCRDFAKGKCTRVMCKYYHVPILPGSALLSRLLSPGASATAPAPTGVSQRFGGGGGGDLQAVLAQPGASSEQLLLGGAHSQQAAAAHLYSLVSAAGATSQQPCSG